MIKKWTKQSLLFSTVVIAIAFTLSCVSSSDQKFSDPNNPDQTSASIAFLATGIMSGMRSDLGIYLRVTSVFSRETYYFEPSDPRYTGELLTGPIDPGGFLLTRPWTARYRVVKNCNLLIQRADEEFDSGAAGFAKTMLAYQLLLNLSMTDTNGIRTDVGGDVLGPFVSKSQAMTFIAAQLDEGYNDLSAAESTFSFDLTSGFDDFDTPATFAGFNRGLRARVAAYTADWDGVISALSNSFIDTSASPVDVNLGIYHVYGTGTGDQANPIYEVPSADTIKYHGHPTFETDAEAGDSRYATKVVKRGSRTFSGLTSDLGITTTTGTTGTLPIMRNEELILLRAEANIQLGSLSAAQDDLNLVRAAAGLDGITLSDQASALTQMLHERRYSLFTEGHRWIDMRRYGLLGTLPIDRDGDSVISIMPIPTSEEQQ